MRNFKFYSLLLLAFMVAQGCNKPLPNLEGINLQQWRADKRGCNRVRTPMIGAIDGQKEKLKSLTENQIVSLLGTPDETQLEDRNQKFYYYYMEPAPFCEKPTSRPKKLILRFNAMDLVYETYVR